MEVDFEAFGLAEPCYRVRKRW